MNNFSVDITSTWDYVREIFMWAWSFFTTDFLKYGNLSFSLFDLFFGFTFVGILLRLVFTRMHLATAVANVRSGRSHGRTVDDNGQQNYLDHTYPVKK